jgi:hypothetical protein
MSKSNSSQGNFISNFINVSKNILSEDTGIHNVAGLVNKHRISVTNSAMLQEIVKEIAHQENDTAFFSNPFVFHRIFYDSDAKLKFQELLSFNDLSALGVQLEMRKYFELAFINLMNSLLLTKNDCDTLYKRSILLNARDHQGKTLLHYALYNSCWNIIDILLRKYQENEYQLDLNIQDNNGRTPLNTTPKIFFSKPGNLEKEEYLRIFRLLVKSGSNLFIADLSNELPWRILQNHSFDETDFFGKGLTEERPILELYCYPETNYLLFNELDIDNILKP